ncbi:hypothetical protein, partial [Sphingomonas sp. KC8]|uniref:hypothetical protein n=1 Tax=Sphingomonas sp. KC8 TaxID=1030157 RepID=UPI000248BEA5
CPAIAAHIMPAAPAPRITASYRVDWVTILGVSACERLAAGHHHAIPPACTTGLHPSIIDGGARYASGGYPQA